MSEYVYTIYSKPINRLFGSANYSFVVLLSVLKRHILLHKAHRPHHFCTLISKNGSYNIVPRYTIDAVWMFRCVCVRAYREHTHFCTFIKICLITAFSQFHVVLLENENYGEKAKKKWNSMKKRRKNKI